MPGFALNHLFLADIYFDMNKDENAKTELMNVLKSPENNKFDYAAENRIYKQRGKIIMREHFPGYF